MVVIKKNKLTKDFHEYLLAATYSIMSVLMAHPSVPPPAGKLALGNEGNDMRNNLKRLGIPTPFLISITDDTIVEEYVGGGNLYNAFADEEHKKNSNMLFGIPSRLPNGKVTQSRLRFYR